MTPATSTVFDVSAPWRLSEQVSLRDEPFGALAYHHGTRRLVFLKSRTLVDLVRALGSYATAADAITSLVLVDEAARYEAALSSLFESGVINGR